MSEGAATRPWPTGLAGSEGAAAFTCPELQIFTIGVATSLRDYGYCVVQAPPAPEEAHRNFTRVAREQVVFGTPPRELKEHYLGSGSAEKIAWFPRDEPLPEEAPEGQEVQRFAARLHCLHDWLTCAGDVLGFAPNTDSGPAMLRRGGAQPARGATGPPDSDLESITAEDVEAGMVKEHLRFIQNRRVCAMYFVDVEGGALNLHGARAGSSWGPVRLPVARDMIVVFRGDAMSYSYEPEGDDGLALQSWLSERPPEYVVDGFAGSQQAAQRILGGPALPLDRQVHIMAVQSKFNGACRNQEGTWLSWTWGTQGAVEIPTARYDISLYYTETDELGKTGTKHQALLDLTDWLGFDNAFFGIKDSIAYEMPPPLRSALECSMELLFMGGFTRDSLRGAPLVSIFASCGYDWLPWHGYQSDPNAWLQAGGTGESAHAGRISHGLGITGPSFFVDTACSSSLTAVNIGHAYLRQREKGFKAAFSMGSEFCSTPFPLLGMYSAHMIGPGGRCKFADISANGFNQGEGTGGILQMYRDDVQAIQSRLGCLMGTFINQDGRSASLTAPNGPSQQLCFRGSMRDALATPADYALTESHGTGTALGDPIEVGSIAACCKGRQTDAPLGITSKKAHNSHLVSTSGSVTIIACLLAAVHAGQAPQIHLRTLNSNMDVSGFPAFIPVEAVHVAKKHLHNGCSSFGFGGTNTRADIWARVLYGPEKSNARELMFKQADDTAECCPRCLGPMCWLCKTALPAQSSSTGRHHCSAIREGLASYEYCSICYRGDYAYRVKERGDDPLEWGGHKLYMNGTWSAWTTFEEMVLDPGSGYVGQVVLGETRLEHFYIVLDEDLGKAIFPISEVAGQRARVLGPGSNDQRKAWRIDGRRDGAAAGTVYRIVLQWSAGEMSISWEATPGQSKRHQYDHSYSIAGSMTEWGTVDMIRSPDAENLWLFTGHLGTRGREQFQLLRDGDRRQVLHPLHAAPGSLSVPVMGPARVGREKSWAVLGAAREALRVQLRVLNGEFEVTATTAAMDITWRSDPGGAGESYSIVGSWSLDEPLEMQPDGNSPNTFTAHFTMGRHSWEEFHIMVNHDRDMIMHPATAAAPPGVGVLCGPDSKGEGLRWRVAGPAGVTVKITLNLAAHDNCTMVTCALGSHLAGA